MMWEYMIIEESSTKRSVSTLRDLFDGLGEIEWELIAVDNQGRYYFKRPIAAEI